MADIIERIREKDAEDQQQDAKEGKSWWTDCKGSRNAKIFNGDFYPEQKEEGWTRTKEIQTFHRHRNCCLLKRKGSIRCKPKEGGAAIEKGGAWKKKVQQEGPMAQQGSLTKMLCENIKSQQKQQEHLLQQMQLQNTALLTLVQGALSRQKDTLT